MAFTYEINNEDDIDFVMRSLSTDVQSGIEEYDKLKISLSPCGDGVHDEE